MSYLTGVAGAVVDLVNHALPPLPGQDGPPGARYKTDSNVIQVVQTYFQAIVLVQRVHIVNAYKIDGAPITICEVLAKRWPEALMTLWLLLFLLNQFTSVVSFSINYIAFSGMAVIVMSDLGISYYTLSKVHRMLNTQMTVSRWAWTGLTYRPHVLRSTASLSDEGDKAAIRRILRSWILQNVSLVLACFLLSIAWITDSLFTYMLFTNSGLLCGSLWQRGTVLYIEAIRHVLLSNRRSKQYLGTATKTGIQLNTGAQKSTAVSTKVGLPLSAHK
ncbi:hypothetical protein RI367_005985 [Sorochytrium milnesiophthora]